MGASFTPSDTFRFAKIANAYDDGVNSSYRSEYRRDYGRVLHSPSFRRLEKKTQLFPGQESDFFRNRLTHSLEVAQIAKTIANKLIRENENNNFIEPDVCEIAGLIHDLGHPPFGHNGEKALDDCMKDCGGFEGNAQTLHIIARLEKKECVEELFAKNGKDNRCGLNLTARSIAASLKYDSVIPIYRDTNAPLVKGYYLTEKPIVDEIKEKLVGTCKLKKFKTIECSIMDIADDIAYSTYDIEDAFKAKFLTPFEMMSASEEIYEQISKKLEKDEIKLDAGQCRNLIISLFSTVWQQAVDDQKALDKDDSEFESKTVTNLLNAYWVSKDMTDDGYKRTRFSSYLISRFIGGVKLTKNEEYPILSTVTVNETIKKEISILKHFAYVCLINSSRLKVVENRGYEILVKMFGRLVSPDGYRLLPEDFQHIYNESNTDEGKRRLICDFLSGMTDRYAIEFYGRLFSENPQSIFKPL